MPRRGAGGGATVLVVIVASLAILARVLGVS